MSIVVRKVNLLDKDENGIAKDFLAVRDFFNEGIQSGEGFYRFVPRKNLITIEEVKNLWMRGAEKNICLVAEQDGEIVGAFTVLYNIDSNEYRYRETRKPGAVSEGISLHTDFELVLKEMCRVLIEELRDSGRSAVAIFPIEDRGSISVLESFGLKGIEKEHEPYRAISLSGKAIEFILP